MNTTVICVKLKVLLFARRESAVTSDVETRPPARGREALKGAVPGYLCRGTCHRHRQPRCACCAEGGRPREPGRRGAADAAACHCGAAVGGVVRGDDCTPHMSSYTPLISSKRSLSSACSAAPTAADSSSMNSGAVSLGSSGHRCAIVPLTWRIRCCVVRIAYKCAATERLLLPRNTHAQTHARTHARTHTHRAKSWLIRSRSDTSAGARGGTAGGRAHGLVEMAAMAEAEAEAVSPALRAVSRVRATRTTTRARREKVQVRVASVVAVVRPLRVARQPEAIVEVADQPVCLHNSGSS